MHITYESSQQTAWQNLCDLAQVKCLYLQVDSVDGKVVRVTKNVLPCTLIDATKNLIELIFSNDMFKEAMECMNLGRYVSVYQAKPVQVPVGK